MYLLPRLGARSLADLDAEAVTSFKAGFLTKSGAEASGKEGSGKPLSPRTVAKILTLLGTVFRCGKRIGLMRDNPAADVKKPRAVKKAVYTLAVEEIARLRAALTVPSERLLVELAITTGLRSGEIRGLVRDSIDLEGNRLFVEHQATRRRDDDATKSENALRTVPLPAYLVPDLKRWELACPPTERGLVFPGEPDASGIRGMRHLAGTLMSEAGYRRSVRKRSSDTPTCAPRSRCIPTRCAGSTTTRLTEWLNSRGSRT